MVSKKSGIIGDMKKPVNFTLNHEFQKNRS